MRIVALSGLAIAAILELAAPAAAAGPAWCAAYRNGSTNCGFNTHEQCMAAISGIGGFCNRNYIDGPLDKPAARKERKEREAEPKARRKEKEEVKERVAPKTRAATGRRTAGARHTPAAANARRRATAGCAGATAGQ